MLHRSLFKRRYDHAEGGVADVQQLDALLRALRFSQAKADDQVGQGEGRALCCAARMICWLLMLE